MSWIFGVIPKRRINDTKILSIINKLVYKYFSDKIQIYTGGLENNLHFCENKSSKNNGWFVSGVGIESKKDNSKILQRHDWKELIEHRNLSDEFENMDGRGNILG